MQEPSNRLTEEKLAEDFDKIQREVAEQIREYEELYPELAGVPRKGGDVVIEPVYQYDIHTIS